MKSFAKPKLTFFNGVTVEFDNNLVKRIVANRRFHIFFISSTVIFYLLKPYQADKIEDWLAATIISLSGVVIVGMYLFAVWAWSRYLSGRLYTAWILVICASTATLITTEVLHLPDTPMPLRSGVMIAAMFHLFMFAAMETIFVIYVLPDVLNSEGEYFVVKDELHPRNRGSEGIINSLDEQEAGVSPAMLEAIAPRSPFSKDLHDFVIISGKKIPAEEIYWVMAQEHYVKITTSDNQAQFVRGRIRDFLKQMPDVLGYCIHRSYWIAWDQIDDVAVDKDSMVVRLKDGNSFPVARGRRSDFIARWNRRLSEMNR